MSRRRNNVPLVMNRSAEARRSTPEPPAKAGLATRSMPTEDQLPRSPSLALQALMGTCYRLVPSVALVAAWLVAAVPASHCDEVDVMFGIQQVEQLIRVGLLAQAEQELQQQLLPLRPLPPIPPLSSGYHQFQRLLAEVYLESGLPELAAAAARSCLEYLDHFADDSQLIAVRRDVNWLLARSDEVQKDVAGALEALDAARQLNQQLRPEDRVFALELLCSAARLRHTVGDSQYAAADTAARELANALQSEYRLRRLAFDNYDRCVQIYAQYLDDLQRDDQALQLLTELQQLYREIPSPSAGELARELDLVLRIAGLHAEQRRTVEQLERLVEALQLDDQLTRTKQAAVAGQRGRNALTEASDLLRRADLHRRLAVALAPASATSEVRDQLEQNHSLVLALVSAVAPPSDSSGNAIGVDATLAPPATPVDETSVRQVERAHLRRSRQLYQQMLDLVHAYQVTTADTEESIRQRAAVVALRRAAAGGRNDVNLRLLALPSGDAAALRAAAVRDCQEFLDIQASLLLRNDVRLYDTRLTLGNLYAAEGGEMLDKAVPLLEDALAFYEVQGYADRQVRALRALADVARARDQLESAQSLLRTTAREICIPRGLSATQIGQSLLRIERSIAVSHRQYADAMRVQRQIIELGAYAAGTRKLTDQLDLIELELAARMPRAGASDGSDQLNKLDVTAEIDVAKQLEDLRNALPEGLEAARPELLRLDHQRALLHFINNLAEPDTRERMAARRIWQDLLDRLATVDSPTTNSPVDSLVVERGRTLYYLARLRYLDWSETYDQWKQRIQQPNLARSVPYARRRDAFERRLSDLNLEMPLSDFLKEKQAYTARQVHYESQRAMAGFDAEPAAVELQQAYARLSELQQEWTTMQTLHTELEAAFAQESLAGGFQNQLRKRDIDVMLDEAIEQASEAVDVLAPLGVSGNQAQLAYAARCSYVELMLTAIWTQAPNRAKPKQRLGEIILQLNQAIDMADRLRPVASSPLQESAAGELVTQLQHTPGGYTEDWQQHHGAIEQLRKRIEMRSE